jgi:hypothetical protein
MAKSKSLMVSLSNYGIWISPRPFCDPSKRQRFGSLHGPAGMVQAGAGSAVAPHPEPVEG